MAQTAQTKSIVRSQIVPLEGMNLVLPNTCIAEVIAYSEPEAIDKAPDWLLGTIAWRGVRIPIISFEMANEVPAVKASKASRIAVLNGLSGESDLSFYGVVVQGIPRLVALDEASINAVSKPEMKLPLALEQAVIADQSAVIPDQDKIENMLNKAGAKVSTID